jgi:negative regulator of flagellin synthesis FlgM
LLTPTGNLAFLFLDIQVIVDQRRDSMKITGSQDHVNQIVQIHETSKIKQAEGLEEINGGGVVTENHKDRVSLSEGSKDLQIALNAVGSSQDIRLEVVEPIKQAIESGTYVIDAEKIAEKILKI